LIALSQNIIDYLRNHFGNDFTQNFISYVSSDPKSYLRLSRFVNDPKVVIENLKNYEMNLEPVENIDSAFLLKSGLASAGKTLEFTLGKYYIQSLSSMIPPLVLNPSENDKVLDLCSAPGSKTTQMAEMMNNRGTLIANESSPSRIKSLVHNLEKLSIVNCGVIQSKGELLSKTFDSYFDKILVDAPCSGVGIVQKKQEVSNWWNEKKVERLSQTQFKLLLSAVKMAKVGGEIIYSTCTLTIEENELVLDRILKKYPVVLEDIELPVKSHPGVLNFNDQELHPDIQKARRIIPWEIYSEGFFIAKLRKTDNTEPMQEAKYRNRGYRIIAANNKNVQKYLKQVEEFYSIPFEILSEYRYILKGNDIFFVSNMWDYESHDPFVRVGSKFATIDSGGNARLHTISAQHFKNHIKDNTAALDSVEELKTYFAGGIIKSDRFGKGHRAVSFKEEIIGTGVAVESGLKSQFPRSLRNHSVLIK